MSRSVTSPQRATISRILRNFDFETMAAMMRLMNWKYFDGFPSAKRLRESAKDLLTTVVLADGQCSSRTGGLRARKDIVEGGTEEISLTFEAIFEEEEVVVGYANEQAA